MKNLIYILLLWFSNSIAQNEPVKKITLAIGTNYPIAFGDNFLKKGYDNDMGYDLEIRFNLGRHLFLGIQTRKNNEYVKNQDLMGNFSYSNSTNNYTFFGYKHKLKSKIFLEHRFGFGSRKMENQSQLSNYKIDGESYLIGSKFIYFLIPEISLCAGLDLTITNYSTILNGPYKDFYSKSYQIAPTLGIQISFWNSKNQSNKFNN